MSGLAVYAGSFDPPTHGHKWMIREGARLFPRLLVAVGVNPDKRYTFPLEKRLEWLRTVVANVVASSTAGTRPHIEVTSFDNQFLVNYAATIGASVILRGIRNESDYAYERAMRHINADLHGDITTVFLMPPRDLCEVSSSTIKGMIGPEGWRDAVRAYVPDCVFADLETHHGG